MENFGLSMLLAILALICGISYACMTLTRKARLLARFPCPGKFPIVGSIPYIFGPIDDAAILFENLINKFGRRVVLWLGPNPLALVILADADGAQKILSSVNYDKGSFYSHFKWLLGKGLITSDGQLWKDDRKLLGPSFKYQKLTGFLPIFNKHSKTLVEILTRTQNQTTNVYPRLARATMDFIKESAFSQDSNFQINDDNFLAATRMALDSFRLRLAIPPLTLVPIIWDRFGLGKQDKVCSELINQAMSKAIEKRKIALALEEKSGMSGADVNYPIQKPFIDVLLDSKSEKDIIAHIVTIFGAGFETTASGMNYTLFLLASNPSAQEKVHLELDSIFGGDINRDVTLNDLSDMKYLEMCIKEALRIFPPVPLVSRNAQEDIHLSTTEKSYRKELRLWFSSVKSCKIRSTTRIPTFSIRTDFSQRNAQLDIHTHIPFSAGPRNCIGMKYAWIQMKTCLAHILRRFRVSTSQKREDISLIYGLTLDVKPQLEIVLTPK
ncbi:LOW QUALITY PROTEIN: cytochrome P450 4g15 [Folsomia candida]|uniref:LOW QUALITY PROTEIN: cytochrome P450 4g15 n=1 Tax=Folsomia candida TaxID=158441 RepID=UPI0016055E8A|nr:LOW QUALITY PROTEIN: cytochrome P450 4g15 [Folsomia candida]